MLMIVDHCQLKLKLLLRFHLISLGSTVQRVPPESHVRRPPIGHSFVFFENGLRESTVLMGSDPKEYNQRPRRSHRPTQSSAPACDPNLSSSSSA